MSNDTTSDATSQPPFDGVMPPSIEDIQHWTRVIGRAQQMLMSHVLAEFSPERAQNVMAQWLDPDRWQQMVAEWTPQAMSDLAKQGAAAMPNIPSPLSAGAFDAAGTPADQWVAATARMWADGLTMWQQLAAGFSAPAGGAADMSPPPSQTASKDRRFAAPEWDSHPIFAFFRQSYETLSQQMLEAVDRIDGVDPAQKAKMRFATQGLIDAISPSNYAMTNPVVMQKTLESRGENLLKGLEHMLSDLRKGQLTHTDPNAFELGRNLAVTPGKVVYETPLFQLIQYAPATKEVMATPLLIFPPWINRFYILDLTPQKSFIRHMVDQGISVFIVSWKSADATLKDVRWDDYIAAQIEAIDVVRELLDVKSVHAIGYCVAGTTLAATLAVLAARGDAKRVKTATFFTAQVDFADAGDLSLFIDDMQMRLIDALSGEGFLDGRYMAATFNALRGKDLIWNYVVNNYLLGNDYPPFDLLHWNGDTTNLPAKWQRDYLKDLYTDNKLVQPGALSALNVPIDLRRVETPCYIQAGREDHIAPPESVWKIMDHFTGPMTFVLAGSGHIAGVVNPPAAGKYQYWLNDAPVKTLDDFVAGATEHPGSWWPHWVEWLRDRSKKAVKADGARIPGAGKRKAIEDAPGRYVKTR